MKLRVAIDGPSASGKTTTARAVAERLGYRYLDSGALYRGVALALSRLGIDPENAEAIAKGVAAVRMRYDEDGELDLNGEAPGPALRTPEIAQLASRLSVHPVVRRWVTARLREATVGGGIVMEGRDIGTVVMPDAEVKVYLDASLAVRARRRHRDLAAAGHEATLESVARDLAERDRRDAGRAVAPLRAADDAIAIEGSGLSFEEQVEAVLELVAARGGETGA